tara:strand:+ start:208 stop:582 length:375 start_codon:yes stop_codon:yes gene_type:complete
VAQGNVQLVETTIIGVQVVFTCTLEDLARFLRVPSDESPFELWNFENGKVDVRDKSSEFFRLLEPKVLIDETRGFFLKYIPNNLVRVAFFPGSESDPNWGPRGAELTSVELERFTMRPVENKYK